MKTKCHCGAVEITLPGKPAYMNDCNCTLCQAIGGVWGYYARAEVQVRGQTRVYTRADITDPAIDNHFCGVCSSNTHWTLTADFQTRHPEMDRIGVNMRLVGDPRELAGVELRFPDGRNWDGSTDRPQPRRSPRVVEEDGEF
jgi:hypothetical protein